MKLFFSTCFLFFVIYNVAAQAPNTWKKTTPATTAPLQIGTDSLFLFVENGQQYLWHTVKAGQTLFSIKKFYAVDLSEIYYNNPTVETTGLKVGQKLRIPFISRALKRYRSADFKDIAFIPVYYKVRPSESLYRISKTYFGMPVEVMKSRNKLLSDELNKNQILHIGWIDKNGIPDSLKNAMGLPGLLGEESQKNKLLYELKFNGKNEKLIQGTACWDNAMDLSAKNKLYVMCSYVPKGSVVRLENPMTNRYLYAKVVAPKPVNSFTQESVVMLTPTVANALGALDTKFYLKLYYCK